MKKRETLKPTLDKQRHDAGYVHKGHVRGNGERIIKHRGKTSTPYDGNECRGRKCWSLR